jgi:transcription antitermination factor NusG
MKAAWYAVRVRALSEIRVGSILNQKRLETFVPSIEERRAYSDRVRRVAVAAFPGYLFCRIDAGELVRVVETPGVQYLVGSGGNPAPVDDDVITSLQTAFLRPNRVSLVPYLKGGDHVRVVAGPLSGAIGVLLRTKGSDRLVISVDLLERSVAVEVDAAGVLLARAS